MTSLSLWQPSSQGPGQVHGVVVEEGGDVDQPSQHCSAHVESWEVPGRSWDLPESSGKSQLVLTVPQSGEASELLAASLEAKATKPKVLLEVGELMDRRKHQLEQRSSLHPRPYPGYNLGH